MGYEVLPAVDVPLSSGARSTAVVQLQTLLREHGFYQEDPDGVVGPKTFAAVYGMWTTLSSSPSQSARDLVAGSYVKMTVGQIYDRLSRAVREHQVYDRSLTWGRGSSSTPTYADQTIRFTPDMLAGGLFAGEEAGAGGDPESSSTSPAVWAIGIGVGLAAIGLAVAAGRASR